jgi:hypothetical protein
MLEQHHQAQALEKSKATQWTDYGLIFLSKVGTPLDHRSLRHVFAFIAKKADVRHLTPHELRHTYRTFMRQAGISTKVTSWLMGHASERITEGYDQSHKDTLEQNRAALSLTALVGIRYDSVTVPQTSQNAPKSTELSLVSSLASGIENNAQNSTKQNEVKA